MSKRASKRAKRKRDQRRAVYDAIRDPNVQKSMKRPGSLNPKK